MTMATIDTKTATTWRLCSRGIVWSVTSRPVARRHITIAHVQQEDRADDEDAAQEPDRVGDRVSHAKSMSPSPPASRHPGSLPLRRKPQSRYAVGAHPEVAAVAPGREHEEEPDDDEPLAGADDAAHQHFDERRHRVAAAGHVGPRRDRQHRGGHPKRERERTRERHRHADHPDGVHAVARPEHDDEQDRDAREERSGCRAP